MIEPDYYRLGRELWRKFTEKPFGSLTKRELELLILQSAISCNIIKEKPADIAKKCCITLTKAHGYLTDLALRAEPLEDKDAAGRLSQLLAKAEVVGNDSMLQFAIHDTRLILWIEINLAEGGLLQGESIRRDVIKISPRALAYLFSKSGRLPTPQEALRQLKTYSDDSWYKDFEALVKQDASWMQIFDRAAGIAQRVFHLIPKFI